MERPAPIEPLAGKSLRHGLYRFNTDSGSVGPQTAIRESRWRRVHVEILLTESG